MENTFFIYRESCQFFQKIMQMMTARQRKNAATHQYAICFICARAMLKLIYSSKKILESSP